MKIFEYFLTVNKYNFSNHLVEKVKINFKQLNFFYIETNSEVQYNLKFHIFLMYIHTHKNSST